MVGFTFANETSASYGILTRSINRTVAPSLRRNEFIIPGRHGTMDFGLNTYDKRLITVEINLVKNKLTDLRQQARNIAHWLSKSGLLIFDDEPDKAYQARVYEGINIEQIATRGISTVIFECQPFAESLEYKQVNVPSIATMPYEIHLYDTIIDEETEEETKASKVEGTSETCCIITIKNIGTTDINDITITRKVEI